MEQPISPFQQLTLLIAAYGALLSTILAVAQIIRERRSVRVFCRLAVTSLPSSDIAQLVSIQAVNTGHRPVEITMAGLLMSNGAMFTQVVSETGRTPLPTRLEDGGRVTVFFDLAKARLAIRDADIPGLRYRRAIVHDAEGKEYSSKIPAGLHLAPNPLFNRSRT